MILLVFSWEEWLADVELVKDASERPHVDGCSVRDAKNDFRCSVEPTLDVCVDLLVLETTRSEVNDFDARFVDLSQQDIFWFQVAMYDVVFSHVVQGNEDLDSESLNQA